MNSVVVVALMFPTDTFHSDAVRSPASKEHKITTGMCYDPQ